MKLRRRRRALEPDELWQLTAADDASARSQGRDVTIRHRAIATLHLPSGRLVACDPAWAAASAEPLARTAPPGRYPVELRIAVDETRRDERVACALVRFSPAEPATWEPAGTYGVDSATGCFASPEALRAFAAAEGEEMLADALGDTYVDTWSWADVAVGPAGENVVAFSPGYGDGSYTTYVGLDARGEPAVALSDFRVLD